MNDEKILCAIIIPHPDVCKGVVQTLEDKSDWSQFQVDLKEDLAIKGAPIKVEFRYFTRKYVDGLDEI